MSRQPPIDTARLTAVVRRALRLDAADLDDWVCDAIDYPVVNPLSDGLFRVSGTARDRRANLPWSLVLKVVRGDGERTRSPSALDYWRREPLAYQSGLLNELSGGLTAPACYGIDDVGEETAYLCLEDVVDRFGGHWPLAHYSVVAQQLGRFNGQYLAGRPVPTQPWLSRGLMRAMVEHRGAAVIGLIAGPRTWEHPLLAEAYAEPIGGRLLRLWNERALFLDALERLPRTFCHFDVASNNLFARRRLDGADETVVIDWAYPGAGAIGDDLSLLVPSPFFRFEAEPAALAEHARTVFAGYVDGLRAAGWRGDVRLARLGYAAATALRTVFLAPGLAAVLKPAARDAEEQRWGRPIAAILAQRAPLTRFLLDLADEARGLLNVV